MSDVIPVSVESARKLVMSALRRHNTSETNAASVAAALIAAEIDGQVGHGLSRLPSYAAQAAAGKVDGHAVPRVVAERTSAVRIDACSGFAFPAIDLALEELSRRATTSGVASAAIFRSHHFGQAGYHVERLAGEGLVAMIFGNSPKAIAPWGGRQGVFGTNPIAFAAPRRNDDPVVIDLSLSKVARGKVMVAAGRGEPIPEGWALDADGNPTTDAKAALEGTMVPMGDAKGAALVLMVEVLAAALTGANFGYEASSFFTAEGEPPAVGQFLIALDPQLSSGGGFHARLEDLLGAMLAQTGVRLPGSRRLEARRRVASEGIAISAELHAEITALTQ
jgi:(2R)-3-sulfolactate dehydrogenase (NADP+)